MTRRTAFLSLLAIAALALCAWSVVMKERTGTAHAVLHAVGFADPARSRASHRVPGRWPELGPSEHNARVRGRIQSKDGAPLVDARVCAFCADCDTMLKGHAPVCVHPDADGHYDLSKLPPGTYRVSATAKGYKPRLANGGRSVALGSGASSQQDAELEQGGGEVSGVVVDAAGGPVAGAVVQAHFLSEQLPYGRWYTAATESDASGAFAITIESGLVMLLAHAEGYAPARFQSNAPARNVQLVLTPSSRITGTVVTHDEQSPVAGIEVTARNMFWKQMATSDDSGAFTIEGLQPGIYALQASGDGWIGQYPGTVTVDISEATNNIVVPVGRAARVLGAIRVGDRPCESGEAQLSPAPGQSLPTLIARAGLAGEIVFEGVPAGNYLSSAVCDRYGAMPGPPITVGYDDVTGVSWSIAGGVDVTVHVKTLDGQPAARTSVQLVPEDGDALSGLGAESSNEVGTVRFYGVKEGAYLVTTPMTQEPERIDVRADAPHEFTVTVSSPGAIEVTVLDAEGQPHDTLAVSASLQDGSPRGGVAERIASGTYYIGTLPTGDYVVQIRDGVNPMIEVGGLVHVQADSVVKLSARYGGGKGAITGRVVDGSGAPLTNVWVSAMASSASADPYGKLLDFQTQSQARRSLTGADGSFSIGELDEAASFTISASYSLGGSTRIEGVRAGQPVELTLPALCELGGVVRDADGNPAEYFRITVSNPSAGQQLSTELGPAAAGAWSIGRIAWGDVEIVADGPLGTARLQRVLAPGEQLKDIALTLAPQLAALP